MWRVQRYYNYQRRGSENWFQNWGINANEMWVRMVDCNKQTGHILLSQTMKILDSDWAAPKIRIYRVLHLLLFREGPWQGAKIVNLTDHKKNASLMDILRLYDA